MNIIESNINGYTILGSVIVQGITYYIDINKKIYVRDGQDFSKVSDENTLRNILDYITPKSIDVR